jgi:polyhydroxybutyrate depolymerase
MFLLADILTAAAVHAATITEELQVGKLERSYNIYVPSVAAQKPVPLIMAFHGGGGSPERLEEQTGFTELAEREGFAVAYMNGTGRYKTWNAVYCCGEAASDGVHEAAYALASLKQISENHPIDLKRVYMIGHSNGGMNVQLLAERLSDVIAGAAAVAGPRFDPVNGGPPMPFLTIHAKDDDVVPMEGGTSENRTVRFTQQKPFLPLQTSVQGWATRNDCQPVPQRQRSDYGYTVFTYKNCVAPVQLFLLEQGAHPWPNPSVTSRKLGSPVRATVNGADVAWNFFQPLSLK